MDEQKFDGIMDQLMSEYANSGMSMDDFIKTKLKASGRPDAEQCAADIIDTINGIDTAFGSLQKFKAEGHNREEWLREEMDDILKDVSPEDGGKLLVSAINSLNGTPDASVDEALEYSGFDAPFLIRELDDALVKNTCENLSGEEK